MKILVLLNSIIAQAPTALAPAAQVAGSDIWSKPITWVAFLFLTAIASYNQWSAQIRKLWGTKQEATITEASKEADHDRAQETSALANAHAGRAAAINKADDLTSKIITSMEDTISDQRLRIESLHKLEVDFEVLKKEYERIKISSERYRTERNELRKMYPPIADDAFSVRTLEELTSEAKDY